MSKSKNASVPRMGAIAGIIAPILGFTCILVAIASYPAFNWINNALSDLGIISGITGPLFNFGLIVSGLLAFCFAIFGLFTYFGKSWFGRIGSTVFAAATLAHAAIGIFNESFSPTHYLVSVTFFVLAPFSLFILTLAFCRVHKHGIAVLTLLVAAAAALPWLLLFAFNYVANVAIPESLSGLAVSGWVIGLSIKILKLKANF